MVSSTIVNLARRWTYFATYSRKLELVGSSLSPLFQAATTSAVGVGDHNARTDSSDRSSTVQATYTPGPAMVPTRGEQKTPTPPSAVLSLSQDTCTRSLSAYPSLEKTLFMYVFVGASLPSKRFFSLSLSLSREAQETRRRSLSSLKISPSLSCLPRESLASPSRGKVSLEKYISEKESVVRQADRPGSRACDFT